MPSKHSTYHHSRGNGWRGIQRRDFRIACCGCGLVHKYNYRIRKGRLERQVFLDARATAAIRRYMSLEDFAAVSAIIQKKVRAFNASLKRNRKCSRRSATRKRAK